MAAEENDRHGYSQPTLAQYDALKVALDRVRALAEHPNGCIPPDCQGEEIVICKVCLAAALEG